MSHNHTATRRQDERGAIMVTVVLIMMMLAGLSAGFLQEGLAERTNVAQRRSNVVALETCEMAVIKASLEILAQRDSGTDGIGAVAGSHAGGSYTVTAQQNPDNPDRWTLRARAEYQMAVRRIEVGLRRRAGGDFVEGLYAKDSLRFNGSTQTDAYDSRLGTWASQAVNSDAGGTFAESGGHVGSNKAISLSGSSVTIRGNAIPGPLHRVTMSGNPSVWGDILPRRVEIDLPAASRAEFEAAFATNDNAELEAPAGGSGNPGGNGEAVKGNGGNGGNGGNSGPYNPKTHALSANGQTLIELPGGTYFFSDVRLTGQAQLRVNGPTTIYVTGDFDVSGGGFVNVSGRPADLRIYAHPYAIGGSSPAASEVKIRGGAQAAMTLYAPGASLTVHGGDDIFGSFVANTITIAGDSKFHYDRSVRDIQSHGQATIERLYWRDVDERIR